MNTTRLHEITNEIGEVVFIAPTQKTIGSTEDIIITKSIKFTYELIY